MRSPRTRDSKAPLEEDDSAAPRTRRHLSSGERAVLKSLAAEHSLRSEDAPHATAQLEAFLEDLIHWTRDSNLVAQNDLGRLASRHVAESLAVLPTLDRLGPKTLIDVGSGAGFPAIPIQIVRPDLRVTLVESRRRKGLFLRRVVEGLPLPQASVIIGRAENLEVEEGAPFDTATARAVAVISELLPWLAPVLRPGGHALLFKGSSHAEDLAAWDRTHDPAWKYVETVPVPDRHLYFVVFERTPAAAK